MKTRPATHRASVLTPAGRGAVAVIAVEGPLGAAAVDHSFHAANGRAFREQNINRVLFGHWVTGSHHEEVIVVRTDEDAFEIHCHGGVAASGRITTALADEGCEIVRWDEWFDWESQDGIHVEAETALTQATTRRAAAILLQQKCGALKHEVATIEHAIGSGELGVAARRIGSLLSRSAIGLHLTNPWQVAIAGRPNVGKSSLINALAGYQRAIVFDEPGTTRDVLSVDTAIDGWPVRLTDAAGIRESCDPLEAEGVARARAQLQNADLVLWVFDLTSQSEFPALATALEHARQEAFAEFTARSNSSPSRLLFVGNKVDLLLNSLRHNEDDLVLVSATHGTGLDHLLSAIAAKLVPSPPVPDEGIVFTPRQVELLAVASQSIARGDKQSALQSIALLQRGSVNS